MPCISVGLVTMDSFLDRVGSSLGDRLGQSKVDNKVKSLLFNPKPRPRKHIPSSQKEHPCGDRGHHEFGGASSYWKLRTAKLREQTPTAVSQIFAGLSFYFNGRTGDKQTIFLKSAVSKHGGRTTPVMSMRGVTHVIAENLSAIKTDKAMKSLKMKVVHPDWVKICIAEGRLLPDAPYRVVHSQKLGVSNYFFASSASVSSLHASEDEYTDVGGCAKQEHNVRRVMPLLEQSLTGQRGRGDRSSNLLKAASREGKGADVASGSSTAVNRDAYRGRDIRRGKGADVASGSSTEVNRDAYRGRDGHGRAFDGGEEGKFVIDLSCYGSGGAANVTNHAWPNGYEVPPSSDGKGGKRGRDDACHGTPRRNRKMPTSSRLTLNCT